MGDEKKRRQNERKFGSWENREDGGRRYWCELKGKHGWSARYVKEVDADETTLRFYQEIRDASGAIVEVHEKYPFDKGHSEIER